MATVSPQARPLTWLAASWEGTDVSRVFSNLAVSGADELIYGRAPVPVSCGLGLTIGGGQVYPEVNFTLPVITVDSANWSAIISHYQEMAANILKRAIALRVIDEDLRGGLLQGEVLAIR